MKPLAWGDVLSEISMQIVGIKDPWWIPRIGNMCYPEPTMEKKTPAQYARDVLNDDDSGSSLPSLKSMASAHTVSNFFSDSTKRDPSSSTLRRQSSHRFAVNPANKLTRSKSVKRKYTYRPCPHCKKLYSDYSAVSQHLKVSWTIWNPYSTYFGFRNFSTQFSIAIWPRKILWLAHSKYTTELGSFIAISVSSNVATKRD